MSLNSDVPTLSEHDDVRYLHFNSEWIQGAMRLSQPDELVFAYTQQMMIWLLFAAPAEDDRLAILGLGAGSLLRFSLRYTPAQIVTVERNPQVVAMARAFFHLPDTPRSVIRLVDASRWVRRSRQHDRYLAMMVDLYDAQAQGPVCGGIDFYQSCYDCLRSHAYLTVNLFADHASLHENVRAIQQVFQGQAVCLPQLDQGNVVVLAIKGSVHLTRQELAGSARRVAAATGLPARRWLRALERRLARIGVFQGES